MRKPAQQFSFSDLARKLKSEQDIRRLEREANRFLAKRGYYRDGRRASEPRESARVVYNHNG